MLHNCFNVWYSVSVYGPYTGDWTEFFNRFMTGEIVYGDPVTWVCNWWKQRHLDNVCIVKYEDIVRDKRTQINKLAAFLQCSFSAEALQKVEDLSSFKCMRESDSTNYRGELKPEDMIRKGQIGDWKNFFTVTQNQQFDKKFAEMMKSVDLDFQYE